MINEIVKWSLILIWSVGFVCTLLGLLLLADHLLYRVQSAWIVRKDAQLAIRLLNEHRKAIRSAAHQPTTAQGAQGGEGEQG